MLLIALIIFFSGLCFFWPSFYLAFGGDEFLALLDLKRALILSGSEWFSWKFFFSNYGPTDLIFGAIYKIFGNSQPAVFIFSFIFRFFTSISVSSLVYLVTKNRFGSFFSGFFFMVMVAGIETTSWSFNLSSYLALGVYCWFLFFWLRYKQTQRLDLFVVYGLLFWISVALQPIRMGGLATLGILLEIFWIANNLNIKNLGRGIVSCTWLGLLFLSFFVLGDSFGIGRNFEERIRSAWSNQNVDGGGGLRGAILGGDVKVFYNYITQLGGLVNPHINLNSSPKPGVERNYGIYIVLLIVLAYTTGRKIGVVTAIFGIFGLLWGWEVHRVSQLAWFPTPPGLYLTWLATGGYVMLVFVYLFLIFFKEKDVRMTIAMSVGWILITIVFFWMRFPREIQMTNHRYLIAPGVGLALILGVTMGMALEIRRKVFLGVIFFLLLLQNGVRLGDYFAGLSMTRGLKKTESIRNGLPKIDYAMDRPIAFYFEAIPADQETLRDAIMFGFPAIVAIRDNLDYFPRLVYVASWNEIAAIVATGDGLQRFGWPIKPMPLTDIYSFRLEGDKMVDITKETREKLSR